MAGVRGMASDGVRLGQGSVRGQEPGTRGTASVRRASFGQGIVPATAPPYVQKMARIVLTSFGSHGDLNPFVGLALALRARGHEPVLALPASYRDEVEREGLAFRPVRPDLDVDDRAMIARVMDPSRGTDTLFRELLIPRLEEAYADLDAVARGADLLVTHPATLAGPSVAEVQGLPWASTALAPISFFSVDDPMVPPPAPWVHAVTSRSRLAARLFHRATRVVTGRWARPVYRFRESLGLPAGGNPALGGQHSPHLVLGLFSRLLAVPQPDWPPAARVTGAVLYNGPDQASLSPELESFLDDGEPPLVFTLGTSAVGAAGSFYDVSAEVARRLGRRAVLLVGRHAENRPPRLGSEILAVEYAPHALLFPRAAAIVHQGGAGTLHQALRSGHPMVIVPHSHDQPDNAHRALRLGVSRTVYPRDYRPRRVEMELRAVLEGPLHREKAEAAAEVVRSEPGAAGAAAALEALL
jgi:rhamnosyltransferase subunit B